MKFKAIMFDTHSIQRYIFSGNRLKTNIGASYLVDQVYNLHLLPVVEALLGKKNFDEETWERIEEPDWQDMPMRVRIGYIGGGKALLLFHDDEEETILRQVITNFTKRLLVECPGLHTGAAIGELELSTDGSYGDTDNISGLVNQLKEQQGMEFPLVNVPYTGLTLSCEVNGEAANAYDSDEERFFSWEVEQKLRADRYTHGEPAEKELLRKLRNSVDSSKKEDFLRGYAFPREIEDLGQKETEDYIAIVHIDGNNMGAKFAGCNSLTKYKNMALSIRQQTISAFSSLLQKVTLLDTSNSEDAQKGFSDLDKILEQKAPLRTYAEYDCYFRLGCDDNGRQFLPVRPLVLGGDDMTFVCAAKAAFPYARYLMEYLRNQNSPIYTCGGIAILPSAYPFFRGYQLAEQLCDAAKKKMRTLQTKTFEESCWLDFAILHGEQAPTLKQIRQQEYRGALGNMHFGPYRVDADASAENSLAALWDGVQQFKTSSKGLPMNKIKDLRRVLAHGRHEQEQILAQLRYLQKTEQRSHLPSVPAWQKYEQGLWADKKTPYVDAIELMDYIEPEKVQN